MLSITAITFKNAREVVSLVHVNLTQQFTFTNK